MSVDFIETVMEMDQSRHPAFWAGHTPWTHKGKTARLGCKSVARRHDVRVDDDGHVTFVRNTVSRPCFGAPTAYLVHGGMKPVKGRNGQYHASRCMRCPAQPGCEMIAVARLNASPRLRDAKTEFELAGGQRQLTANRKRRRPGDADQKLAGLIRELRSHGPFTSVNDDQIRANLRSSKLERLEKDRQRKAQARLRDRMACAEAGNFDDKFLDRLRRERFFRELSFKIAMSQPGAPPWLTKGNDQTAKFTADVWFIVTLLIAMKVRPNPSRIATELIQRSLVETTNQNSLRSGVKQAMDRIQRLENFVITGKISPTWPKAVLADLFDPEDPLI